MKQKYNSIVRRHKTLREKRSVGVAAGTRDHLVNRVEDTLRQMNHSLGTREGEGKRGRLGDREGLIRRWFPRVAHDASDGRSMPLVVTRWCWWWCYGRLCIPLEVDEPRRTAACAPPGHGPPACLALSFPFLSFPFPSPLFPFFSSFPRTSLLDRESPFLPKRIPELPFTRGPIILSRRWIAKIKAQSRCGCLCKLKFLWI